jgi:hypothetical protein
MMEYSDLNASVVQKAMLKMLLVDAAREKRDLVTFDIAQAFCESWRKEGEEIYITIPQDYINPEEIDSKGKVFKCFIHLYGSPDAMAQFEMVLTEFPTTKLNFKQSLKDLQQFTQKENDNSMTQMARRWHHKWKEETLGMDLGET